MAKFFGRIGYGVSQETEPGSGVWEDVITERKYYGDILKNIRTLEETGVLNKDITVNNSVSIVADAFANEHFFAIRYVEWAGVLWDVSSVEVQSPRLILKLGGVYAGPTP
jgi:hypothetical protein